MTTSDRYSNTYIKAWGFTWQFYILNSVSVIHKEWIEKQKSWEADKDHKRPFLPLSPLFESDVFRLSDLGACLESQGQVDHSTHED